MHPIAVHPRLGRHTRRAGHRLLVLTVALSVVVALLYLLAGEEPAGIVMVAGLVLVAARAVRLITARAHDRWEERWLRGVLGGLSSADGADPGDTSNS